jgi:integrase
MAKKTLTALAVENLKPATERREIPDAGAPGLYLIVQPSGAKSWAMRFRRPNGKAAKLTLGPVDLSSHRQQQTVDEKTGKPKEVPPPKIGTPLSLVDARLVAAEINNKRASDLDVIADHRTDKEQKREDAKERWSNTFDQAVRDFIDNHVVEKTGKKPRRWREMARVLGVNYPVGDEQTDEGPETIKQGLSERWRDKPTADITQKNIRDLIKEAEKDGIPGLGKKNKRASKARARNMASVLGSLFKYLSIEHGTANPCLGLHRPKPPAKRGRVLNAKSDKNNADELRWFWAATDKVGEPFGALFKLLLLTGCRRGELAGMSRDELTDDFALLGLPGDRTKNSLPHNVPLAPLARKIVKDVEAVPGSNRLIFTTNGRTPISGFSKFKKRLDAIMLAEARKERGKEFTIDPWRIHDLRRTCSTGMHGIIKVPPHVVEACLNHISGAKAGVAGTYNVEEYAPEKRAALEDWANYVERIVSGKTAKVVPMVRGKK